MILESAINGNPKTRIMLSVGLSFYQLNEYLEVNLKSGLLTFESKNKIYRITDRGLKYLKLYDQLNDLMDSNIMPVKNKKKS